MARRDYTIEMIGFGLALLYAASCLIFLYYIRIPGFELPMMVYLQAWYVGVCSWQHNQ